MFSAKQIRELVAIIDLTHFAFIGENIGSTQLTTYEINLLKRHGINTTLFPKMGAADLAFRFGLIADALGKKEAQNMSFPNFKKFLDNQGYLPYTKQEEYAIDHIKHRMTDDVRGLSSRIKHDITNMNAEEARRKHKKYRKIVDTASKHAVADNSSVTTLANNIHAKLGNWSRDFDRIADYTLHEAFDMGKAMSIWEKSGEDSRVYKEVFAGACKHCIKAYTSSGIGSRPRVFKLSAIMSNGTNIGRKNDDSLPIIGPHHPFCFINPAVKIYTTNGWKNISDIIVGDEVLTHKRRFKKVIKLIRHKYDSSKDDIYNVKVSVNSRIVTLKGVTGNHPFLTNSGWKETRDIKNTNKLFLITIPCKNRNCEEKIPLFAFGDKRSNEYCCKSCQISERNNHSGNYGIIGVKVVSIERVSSNSINTHFRKNKDKLLYNFSVEDDQSYIVNGVVVHNCRCELFHIPKGYMWNEKTGAFEPRRVKKVERKSKAKITIS